LALFIWYNEAVERWEESLPKKLNAHFIFHDEYVYSCYGAELTNVSDIKTWDQQLGKQMNNDKNLPFYPNFKIIPKDLQQNESGSY